MGIYIEGMEMPTTCGKCKIKNAIKCNKWELVRSVVLDRHRDCPLVPVPEHGRLIDADAFLDDLLFPSKQFEQGMRELVADAPTIIPASFENPTKNARYSQDNPAEEGE